MTYIEARTGRVHPEGRCNGCGERPWATVDGLSCLNCDTALPEVLQG